MLAIDTSSSNERKVEERKRLTAVSPINVLIVDDDQDSIAPLMSLLELQGCSVIFAQDGYEAVDLLNENDAINLVILDWNMPEIGGDKTLEMAEKTISSNNRSEKKWDNRHLSVVTYTSEDYHKMRFPMTSHFAFVDHWSKSMDVEDLLFHVQAVMSYVGNRRH